MNAAADTIREIQVILQVKPDGNFGRVSRAALEKLIGEVDGDGDMSPEFLAFMPFIFEWEGEVYEDDPDDPGGATKYGIDQRSHPGVDIRHLTKDQARRIYWREWLQAQCHQMGHPYAEVYFNCAVNMGLGRALEFQKAGATTPSAFLEKQEIFYRRLAENGPKRAKYLKGWLDRCAALRKRFNLMEA